mmetsp:Transcript_31465/g.97206  ORF Transcript_31465/g.97206 Transcript_31465/m.97206 type:complete len:234 (-) Transcript_31465:754-1455(-)
MVVRVAPPDEVGVLAVVVAERDEHLPVPPARDRVHVEGLELRAHLHRDAHDSEGNDAGEHDADHGPHEQDEGVRQPRQEAVGGVRRAGVQRNDHHQRHVREDSIRSLPQLLLPLPRAVVCGGVLHARGGGRRRRVLADEHVSRPAAHERGGGEAEHDGQRHQDEVPGEGADEVPRQLVLADAELQRVQTHIEREAVVDGAVAHLDQDAHVRDLGVENREGGEEPPRGADVLVR